MPIKFTKGLRRKSTSNGLEDTATTNRPVESSFRVLERPHSGSRSIDGTAALKHTQKDGESDPFPDNIFAGLDTDTQQKNNRYEDAFTMNNHEDSSPAHTLVSAHAPVPPAKPVRNKWLTKLRGSSSTANTSTGRPYDSSASSAKYSSSSTLPSSAGGSSHDVPRVPEAPYSFSLRAAGRTFSFGSKSKVAASASKPSSRPQTKQSSLARPATTSTSSTATPPRLPESSVKVDAESDWGDMFEGLDKRQSIAAPAAPALVDNSNSTPAKEKRLTLPGLLAPFNRKKNDPSPPSPCSDNSGDGLMGQSYIESAPPPPQNIVRPADPMGRPMKRTQTLPQPPVPPFEARDPDVSSIYGSDNDFTHVPLNRESVEGNTSIMPLKKQTEESAFSAEAAIAARYEQALKDDSMKPSKVMTASQFEMYKQQKELARQDSNASSSTKGDDYEDDGEDEDEAETRRKAIAMRTKQEAHLTVYRQQMMKVTGQQAAATATSPTQRNSFLAVPNTNRSSSSKSKSSEGDDDEDVPLGILAAHGFPSQNRPPTRLQAHSSNPNLRASLQPSFVRPSSGTGHRDTNRKTLPVFARNLPADPYYGAGLVNQPNRQSLAMRSGTPNTPALVPPGVPPGGLVQIIADEEVARQMRRGSPNTPLNMRNSAVGGPGTLLGQHDMRQSYMPQQEMAPVGEQAQTQASMAQLVQLQMQFISNMMAMQSGQIPPQSPGVGPNIPPGNGYLSPHPPGPPRAMSIAQQPRPNSMLSSHSFGPGNARRYDQRTLSMLDPSMSARNRQSFIPELNVGGVSGGPAPGYAPSIAPSERSNVGRSPRYRPVSTARSAVPELGPRASTFTSGAPTIAHVYGNANANSNANINGHRHNSLAPTQFTSSNPGPARPISALRHTQTMPVTAPEKSVAGAGKEEEDEDGWEKMLEAREKKKNGWKFKKSVSSLGDFFSSEEHHDRI